MAKTSNPPQSQPSTGILISLDALVALGQEISILDTKIASASGSDTAAKKELVNQIIAENQERVETGTEQFITALQDVPTEVLVGLVAALEDRIKTEFGEKISAFVDERYANIADVSKEQVGALRETRKALATKFKALRGVLESFGQDTASVPDPKRSGGGRPPGSTTGSGSSKSGQNREGYRYSIDGKNRPASQNQFSSVAYYATEGCPNDEGLKRWGADRLKAFLAENGVTLGEDPEWSVTLPNGKVVAARRFTDQDRADFGLDETDSESEEAPVETPIEETAA